MTNHNKRNPQEIGFSEALVKSLVLKTVIGDMTLPATGGIYIVDVPTGMGKSTGIVSLVALKTKESFIIFVRTREDCQEMYSNLIIRGAKENDITVIYSPSPEELEISESYVPTLNPFHTETYQEKKKRLYIEATKKAVLGRQMLYNEPEKLSMVRVIIMPSNNLYTSFLPALFSYTNGTKPVDIEKYVGKTGTLLKDPGVCRNHILIDEDPSFINPYIELDPISACSHYRKPVMSSGVQIGSNKYGPMSYAEMKGYYDSFLVKSVGSRFFIDDNPYNRLRTYEILYHIGKNYNSLAQMNSKYLWTLSLNEIFKGTIKGVVYIFDGTLSVLSNYSDQSCEMKLVRYKGPRFFSPTEFKGFGFKMNRWSQSTYKSQDQELLDTAKALKELIDTLVPTEKLLVYTWKYLAQSGKATDSEIEEITGRKTRRTKDRDEDHDYIKNLGIKLGALGIGADRYEFAYYGSGKDRGTNQYKDFAAVAFLGAWAVKNILGPSERNYGIRTTRDKIRLANFIQAVARIRIRNHDGDSIKIFYSEDIPSKLLKDGYNYFKSHTAKGIPVIADFMRLRPTVKFTQQLRILVKSYPDLLVQIKAQKNGTWDISLPDLTKALPIGQCVKDSYNNFVKQVRVHYKIKINIL